MGVKGSWWRGGWNQKYADNHEKIFGNKKEVFGDVVIRTDTNIRMDENFRRKT